ncbi:hypothetical protein LOTGIDRAFT_174069 [Lottia gigantea]|uniref:Uncharacterized protein n=1 Tax=Lottia gigantea TaxID=225164 RepID=V4AYD2_LOTGI|nr:hypothetical protein LOTGIDRAFT_174069 [Lottia gigantea]ESO98646.1 hypothetical protein LOTGIDRAFT_174069 [Lottia gigantea]
MDVRRKENLEGERGRKERREERRRQRRAEKARRERQRMKDFFRSLEALGSVEEDLEGEERLRKEEEASKRAEAKREERRRMQAWIEEIEVLEEDVGEVVEGEDRERRLNEFEEEEDWSGWERGVVPERVGRRREILGCKELERERERGDEEKESYCCCYGCMIM